MRRLTLTLDALAILRSEAKARDVDVAGAATLASLAAVGAVRPRVNEEPVPFTAQAVRDGAAPGVRWSPCPRVGRVARAPDAL